MRVLSIPPMAALLLVLAASGASAHTREAMVLLDRDSSDASASAEAVVTTNSLARSRRDVPQVGLVTVRVPAGESFDAFSKRLSRDPRVQSVQRNRHRSIRYQPNDPAITKIDRNFESETTYQWYLQRQNLYAAWDVARGDGVKVGIIDTGIDSGNPDLGPKVDAVVDQDSTTSGTGDEVGHGTHVSGLACGGGNNGFGMVGTGFNCRLIVEKTDLSASSIVASIVDATNRGAKVINMSFGGRGETPGEKRALAYAVRKDVVLVAAAADTPDVNQGHPASDLQPMGTGPKLGSGYGLVVTAAGMNDQRAFFAGRGSQISVASYGYTAASGAPGIFSTFPANTTQFETGNTQPPSQPCGDCRATFNGDNRYGYLFGTSMAAPQVTGIAALVRSANPRMSNIGVVRTVKDSARGAGWNSELGWGIVDADAAVRMAKSYAPDTVAPETKPQGLRSRSSGSRFKLKWRSSDRAPAGVRPSGLESYRVYARRGGRYQLVSLTSSNSQSFTGSRGAKYSFYVQARDMAGNSEPPPGRTPDFVVRVRR